MIVPMKKISVVVQSKDVDSTLYALGKAGVLHIEHQNAPVSEDVTGLEEKHRFLLKAMELLPDIGAKDTGRKPEDLVCEILNLVNEKELVSENLKKLNREIEAWKEWGDFDPELIEDLSGKDIWVRLCKITRKETEDIPGGVILEQLFRKGNILYCVAVSKEEIALPFETLSLPEQGLQDMLLLQEKEKDRIRKIEERLIELAQYKNILSSYKSKLESLIEFNKAIAGIGRFEALSYLRGYCPFYNVNLLERIAGREKWALIVEDPGESDNAPTLIKNPAWLEIIKPVFQIIKTIPGYSEMDISFWFLIFFSVFFGMLIGDAGYGLVFFIINLVCHAKFKNRIRDKSIFFLLYVLSLCAITWGVLSGTFFGQTYFSGRAEPLLPFLRENETVQALCFFIGAMHLSIAHLWRFLRKLPSIKALAEAGWILMLWAMYFVAKSLILGRAFPEFGKWFLAGGAVLIILFTNPRRNIFRAIGSGIGDFLLHVVTSFTDVVSYIRLFAVGAATVAVADAFNRMAGGIGYGSFFTGFLTAFILLFGHTLNILLGAMAVLVHGVRLNLLEFSSHLNMEWTGVEYKPFQVKTQLTEQSERKLLSALDP